MARNVNMCAMISEIMKYVVNLCAVISQIYKI